MAQLKLINTIQSKLNEVSNHDGQLILEKDGQELFFDFDGARIPISDWIEITDAERSVLLTPLPNKFYFTTDTHNIYRYIGNEWVQIISSNQIWIGPVKDAPESAIIAIDPNQTEYITIAEINDNVTSTEKTWSSSKISQYTGGDSVKTVNNIKPDANGNVVVNAGIPGPHNHSHNDIYLNNTSYSIPNLFRSMIDSARANHFMFLPANQIIIEETIDGGVTWQDAQVPDIQKTMLFSQLRPTIKIPLLNGIKSTLCGLRITITGMEYNVPQNTPETEKYNYWNDQYLKSVNRYCEIEDMYFWVSPNSDALSIKLECAKIKSSNTWNTLFDSKDNYRLAGWPGPNYIKFNHTVFGCYMAQDRETNWRMTFFTTPALGQTELSSNQPSTQQNIYDIRGFGSNVYQMQVEDFLGSNDHLYWWDANRNANFPAGINAASFNGYTIKSSVPSNANFISKDAWNDATNHIEKIYDIVGYNNINLVAGTKNWSGNWHNLDQWDTVEETYQGLTVKKNKNRWLGLYKEVYVEAGEQYTFSIYAKGATNINTTTIFCYIDNQSFIVQSTPVTTEWQRVYLTFTPTYSGMCKVRLETGRLEDTIYICGYTLSKGGNIEYSELLEPISTKIEQINKQKVIKGTLSQEAGFSSTIPYPAGFSYTTSFITSIMVWYGETWRSGTGINSMNRLFARLKYNGIDVYNNDTDLCGAPFKILLTNIEEEGTE